MSFGHSVRSVFPEWRVVRGRVINFVGEGCFPGHGLAEPLSFLSNLSVALPVATNNPAFSHVCAAKTRKGGKGSERGPRMRTCVLATSAFVSANKQTRDNGEIVSWSPTTTNCAAKKAVYELMRYVDNVSMSDKDVQSEHHRYRICV